MVRSFALCWIWAWCAWAGEATRMAVGFDPAYAGQPVRISAVVWTAIVAPHPITGTIDFTIDGAPIAGCTGLPLNNLRAFCEATFPRAGAFKLGGAYSGDAWWAGSSDAATIAVSKFVPSVYLAFFPASPVYGDKVTVGGRVLGTDGVPPPRGTISFSEGTTQIATVPMDADGHAETAVALATGRHAIVATYSGDDYYRAGFQAEGAVTIAKAAPVVAISSTPAQIDQPVTITASVTALNPSGTVTFSPIAGCAGLPIEDGKASCRTTFAQLGDVTVTANYSGDANVLPGSATLKLKVGRVVASVYVAFDPATPVFGQPMRVSALATAAPGVAAPTGSIFFADGGVPLSGGPLGADGRTAITAQLNAGPHAIAAMYNGDANYGSSQAAATVVVARANTSTSVTAMTGGPFTAVVSPVAPASGAPTGSVRFLHDGQAIGTTPLVPMGAASAATIAVTSQTGNITAEYAGDGNFTGNVGGPVVVTGPRAQVTVTSSRNPAVEGQAATFTATVAPNPGAATPTGNVQFAAGGTTLGLAALSGGSASISATLPVGSHAISATYSGDAIYPPASATFTQVVTATPVILTLSASDETAVYGQAITFTAQATGSATVQFMDGGTTLGSAALASGAARITVTTLPAGTHTISASMGTASAQVLVTIGKARTVTALVWSGVAAVATVSAASGLPSGNVRFVEAVSGSAIGTTPLADGRASVPWVGDSLVAVYAGDQNFLGSISAAVSPLTAANAASYAGEWFAADELVTLFGRNLAGVASGQVTDSGGTVRRAQVLYAAAEQASVVMPADIAPGPATLRVGAMSATITFRGAAPGIFAADSSGKGPAAGIDEVDVDRDPYIVLYGTGIRHYAEKPTCTVGGQPVEVVYAGAQGAFPGLDQVNLLLPLSLRGAGTVTVVLTVDGVAANALTVKIR